MKITVFNSSPNKEKGNTHWIVEQVMQGIRESGADVTNIFLWGKQIHPCSGCYACWLKTPGQCIYKDDMNALMDAFRNSDIVAFATPLYVDNVSGIMKNFMDRLIAYGDPHITRDPQGECRHVKSHSLPTGMLAISNCGFPEQSNFQVLKVLFRRISRNFHCELIGEIYRSAGGLLTRDIPELQPIIEQYRSLLCQAGRELATQGRVTSHTGTALDQPLVAHPEFVDRFIAKANASFDEILKITTQDGGSST